MVGGLQIQLINFFKILSNVRKYQNITLAIHFIKEKNQSKFKKTILKYRNHPRIAVIKRISHRLPVFHFSWWGLCHLPKPKGSICLIFQSEQKVPNKLNLVSRSNIGSADRISISRLNILSVDQISISRLTNWSADQISILRSNIRSTAELVSQDRIFHLQIELTWR